MVVKLWQYATTLFLTTYLISPEDDGRRLHHFPHFFGSVCKLVTFHLFCSICLSHTPWDSTQAIIQYTPPSFLFLLWMTSEQGAAPKGAVRLVWRVLSVSSSWEEILLELECNHIEYSEICIYRMEDSHAHPHSCPHPVESVGQPRYYITKTSHELNHSVILAKLIILHAVLTCHPHFSHEILSLYVYWAWWRYEQHSQRPRRQNKFFCLRHDNPLTYLFDSSVCWFQFHLISSIRFAFLMQWDSTLTQS